MDAAAERIREDATLTALVTSDGELDEPTYASMIVRQSNWQYDDEAFLIDWRGWVVVQNNTYQTIDDWNVSMFCYDADGYWLFTSDKYVGEALAHGEITTLSFSEYTVPEPASCEVGFKANIWLSWKVLGDE